jgi:hypothetical protein
MAATEQEKYKAEMKLYVNNSTDLIFAERTIPRR